MQIHREDHTLPRSTLKIDRAAEITPPRSRHQDPPRRSTMKITPPRLPEDPPHYPPRRSTAKIHREDHREDPPRRSTAKIHRRATKITPPGSPHTKTTMPPGSRLPDHATLTTQITDQDHATKITPHLLRKTDPPRSRHQDHTTDQPTNNPDHATPTPRSDFPRHSKIRPP